MTAAAADVNMNTVSMDIPMERNRQIYLVPEQLTPNEANEKARPAEKPEQRAARIKAMAESIGRSGQEYPVLVVELDGDGLATYEYVDGGARVEAIAMLNDKPNEFPEGTGGNGMNVWCSIVNPADDLFRTAVVGNLHRTQNSILDMAHICMEARERNGWKGRGAGEKVAEYLGIHKARVSEYEKILRAPEVVKSRIESGEIVSLDAALKLLAVPEAQQGKVAERAVELAREEDAAEEKSGKGKKKGNPRPNVPKADFTKPNVPKVKAKHVTEAARESGQVQPRNKSDIVVFFEQISDVSYAPPVVAFADYLLGTWLKGSGTDRTLLAKFDAMVVKGSKAKAGAPVAKKKDKK